MQPEWRKAWKTDDEVWMKQRRKEWRAIKNSHGFELLKKGELELAKNYFMTGSGYELDLPENTWEMLGYHPDTRPLPIPRCLFFECWLSADQSEKRWLEIKSNHTKFDHFEECKRYFMRRLSTYYHNHESGTWCSGLEGKFYKFFGATRCRIADFEGVFSGEDDDMYLLRCAVSGSSTRPLIEKYLSLPYDKFNIAPLLRLEWIDSLKGSYLYAKEKPTKKIIIKNNFISVLSRVLSAMEEQENYEPPQVQFAYDLYAGLKDLDLPDELASVASPLLNDIGKVAG